MANKKNIFLLLVFFLNGFACCRGGDDEIARLKKILLKIDLFEDKKIYKNEKITVYMSKQNDLAYKKNEVQVLFVKTGTGQSVFIDVEFDKDGMPVMLMFSDIELSKNGKKLVKLGERVGPVKKIKADVEKLLSNSPDCYLMNKSVVAEVVLYSEGERLSGSQEKVLKTTYENFSTSPDGWGGINERKHMVYFSPLTLIDSKGRSRNVLSVLAICAMPEATGANAGVFSVFDSAKNGDCGMPVYFATINTTDKSNKDFHIFQAGDNLRAYDKNEIKKALKQLSNNKSVEVLISRKVSREMELKPCK